MQGHARIWTTPELGVGSSRNSLRTPPLAGFGIQKKKRRAIIVAGDFLQHKSNLEIELTFAGNNDDGLQGTAEGGPTESH